MMSNDFETDMLSSSVKLSEGLLENESLSEKLNDAVFVTDGLVLLLMLRDIVTEIVKLRECDFEREAVSDKLYVLVRVEVGVGRVV